MDSILRHGGAAKAFYDVVKVGAEIRHPRAKLFDGLAPAFREALAIGRTSPDTCRKTDYRFWLLYPQTDVATVAAASDVHLNKRQFLYLLG